MTSTTRWRPGSVFVLLLGDFVLLGITIGVQGVLWASLMASLRISKSTFGTAQLASPLISVGLLLFGGHLSAWLGKKRLAILSLFFLGTASLMLGTAGSLWSFVSALVALGAGNGLFETAMNGATLDWELATRRQVLNLFHGSFSGGTVVGALGAGALLATGWHPVGVFAAVGLLAAVMLVATFLVNYPRLGAQAIFDVPGSTLRLLLTSYPLKLLSLVSILGAVGESVVFLWSVIYLRERGASAMAGGLAFALLSSVMLVGRFANIGIVRRFGPKASLQLSGLGLVCSSILLILPSGIVPAILAFGLMGLAVAGVLPTVLSAGAAFAPNQTGALAASMLAAVYAGFVVTSPLIGLVADAFSLSVAFLIVGVSGLGIWWVARGVT